MTPEDLIKKARELVEKREASESHHMERVLYNVDLADIVPALADALEAALKENAELKHPILKFAGTWQGDDAEECMKRVKETRGVINFDKPDES